MKTSPPSTFICRCKRALVAAAVLCTAVPITTATAQAWQWAAGSSAPHGVHETAPIAVDMAGNVYETGAAYPTTGWTGLVTSTFGPYTVVDSNSYHQGIVVSTDSNGAYRWALGTQAGYAEFMSIAADTYGNIYLIGQSSNFTLGGKSFTDTGYHNSVCVKLSSSGSVTWIKAIVPGAYISNIAVNSSGNLYVSGIFYGRSLVVGSSTLTNTDPSGATDDVLFAKLDSAGNLLWAKSFGGNTSEAVPYLALTSDSNIYISGVFSSAMAVGSSSLAVLGSGGQAFYTAKFDRVGNPLWARATTANQAYDYLNGVAADNAGSVYITGSYGDLVGEHFSIGTDTMPVPFTAFLMFLAKYDSSGNFKWCKTIPDRNFGSSFSAAPDGCGNIWVCGQSFISTNNDAGFAAEFDSAGHLEDTLLLGGGGDDNSAVVVDFKGSAYIGGEYAHAPFVVGADTLTYGDSTVEALFVLKYRYGAGDCATVLQAAQLAAPTPQVSLFPNPAVNECTVQANFAFSPGSSIEIYDLMGRLTCSYPLSATETVIPLAKLKPGIFECRIYNGGRLVETKKLAVME